MLATAFYLDHFLQEDYTKVHSWCTSGSTPVWPLGWANPRCYETVPKKETIFCTFVNLIGNIKEYNMGKI